jgi:hypothetical protein
MSGLLLYSTQSQSQLAFCINLLIGAPFLQSEEDAALKENLELMVERLQDKEAGVQKLALEQLR